jgi:hypothetical protein
MFVWLEILNQHGMNESRKLLCERQMEINIYCFQGAASRYNAARIVAAVAGACAPLCNWFSWLTQRFSIRKKLPP